MKGTSKLGALVSPRPQLKVAQPPPVASSGGLFKLPSVSRSGLRPLWNAAARMGYGTAHNDENKPPETPTSEKTNFVTGFLRTVSGASSTVSKISDYKSAISILKGTDGYDPEKEPIKVSFDFITVFYSGSL